MADSRGRKAPASRPSDAAQASAATPALKGARTRGRRDTPRPGAARETRAPAAEPWDVKETLKSVAWAVLLFFVIRTFLIFAYSIPSESMEETLLVGDYLMANNAVFGATLPFTDIRLPALRDPHRGEIVVFRPEYNEPVMDVVKRVIGIPGDTLQMVDGVVTRNGRVMDEPYAHDEGPDNPITYSGEGLLDPTVQQRFYGAANHLPLLLPTVNRDAYRPTRKNWGPLVVPAGHYWLMGDNRDQSLDSRFMGPIPRDVIRGKPLFIYFSYDRNDPSAGFPRPLTAARWRRIGTRLH